MEIEVLHLQIQFGKSESHQKYNNWGLPAEMKLSLRPNIKRVHPPNHPPHFSSISQNPIVYFVKQYYSHWCRATLYQKNSYDNMISSYHWEKGL